MTADEHLGEALWHLRQAKFHLKTFGLEGAIDSISAAVVVIEDERAKQWKQRIKVFVKKMVG